MGVQFIKTPAGEDLAVLPKAEYEALVAAVADAEEELADIAAYDAAKADLKGSERLPLEVSQAMLRGTSLLKALRIWRDSTQMELASRIGTSQGFVSDLENRRRGMTEEVAGRIAEVLNIPDDWLR